MSPVHIWKEPKPELAGNVALVKNVFPQSLFPLILSWACNQAVHDFSAEEKVFADLTWLDDICELQMK